MSRRFELMQMLEAYAPTPPEERALAEMLDLVRGGGDPFSQYHYKPGHFTVSAFVLTEDRTEVLLVHHRRLDMWIEPGGHVDPTDDGLVSAAMREVEEETGVGDVAVLVDGILDLDAHPIPAYRDEPPHRHFNLTFAFVAPQPAELTGQSDEVHEVIWHPLDRLAELTGDRSTLRAAAKIRAR